MSNVKIITLLSLIFSQAQGTDSRRRVIRGDGWKTPKVMEEVNPPPAYCLPSTKFELFTSGCNYEKLLGSITLRINNPDELNDIIPCPHSAAEELLLLLSVDELSSAETKISDLCKEAVDNFGIDQWSKITKRGVEFDKEYFDGNGEWNEEHQSNYPHLPVIPGQAANVLSRDTEYVKRKEEIVQRRPLEWPEEISNFENCQLQSVMCCWVSDRQANDNNGNCATPYDERCTNADPGDNTDVCAVDMSRSGKDSVHVNDGFALFHENDEGPVHCDGFAWGEDENEPEFRYRANNLFHISMIDHLRYRGYVRAVQGAPMCACTEKMPIVSRSDCKEISAKEFYKFTFHAPASDDIRVSLDYVDIDFNACRASKNNNLQRYYERLVNEGRVSRKKYDKFRETVVGDGGCPSVIADLLFEKGYKYQAQEYEGWTQLYGRGRMISPMTQPQLWNEIDQGSYVRRICKGCSIDSHKDIIYKRLEPKGEIDYKELFLKNWFSDPAGDGKNIRGTDFNLFSSFEDAQNNENPWEFCNYNDGGVGFPRDCGPTGHVSWQWNAMDNPYGVNDFAFYLYTGTRRL